MFVIDVPFFNLNHIYNSSQCPRWIKLSESKYIIPFRDKALKIEQRFDISSSENCHLIMNCSEEDFYNIWFDYLDLRTDYLSENYKIKRLCRKLKIPANRGSGIHILHQDSFEAYVFAKLVGFVGYKKAGELMNRIAQAYGIERKQSMREAGRVTWYEWPTPERMLEKLLKEKIKSDNKVKRFLRDLCKAIVSDGYEYTSSDNELFRLFGMHDMTVFPLNGIEEALSKNPHGKPDEFADQYLYNVENKGLAYEYIVHHVMNKPKEANPSGIG